MTLIKSNSFSVSSTKNDNEVKEIKDVKQPKQIQKVLDSIGFESVKPVKQKNEEPKLSKSENVQNTIEKSIERFQKTGKPLSDIKVDDLVKIKDGLKKIEVGSGVDKSKSIPKPSPQLKTSIQRAVENKFTDIFNQKNELMDIINVDSSFKKEAFYKFSKKEFSNENIDFLDSVKVFIKKPSMEALSELYDSKIQYLNINGKDMKELPIQISKGNIDESLDLLKGIISDVNINMTDTFFRFSQTPEYELSKVNDAKSNILDEFKVKNNDKFDIKVFIKSPEKFKELEKFAVKDLSYEDIKFLGSINKFANKPDLSIADLSQLYINYLSPKGASSINLTSKEQKLVNEFKTCIENQDLEGALNKLPNIVSKSLSNAMEPFSRFRVSDECKEIIQKDMSISINDLINGNPTKDKFTQTNLETKKEFIDFSAKLSCKENLDFLNDIRALLPKPTMADLKSFQKKYDIDKKVSVINFSDGASKPFNEAIANNDYLKAFDSLSNMITEVKFNVTDTYNKFKKSEDFKALLDKEILKPIEKLPVRSQLKALDEAIKDNPSIAKELNSKKTELLEKYLPKISLSETNNLSEFVSGFKKATDHFKTNLFGGEIKNVYKALDKLEESLSISTDKKEQLNSIDNSIKNINAIDNAIKQVDTFITKRGKESSKIEWVEALVGRLQELKQLSLEKYSQTPEGKSFHIKNSTNSVIQFVKNQNITNFDTLSDSLKNKAKESIEKDPHGEAAWSISTSNEFKKEVLGQIEKEFPKLKDEQKEILVDKIYNGYKEGLPVKLINENSETQLIVDGEIYKPKKEINRGGFGIIFKYESESGKALAVKSFDTSKPTAFESFLAESESHKLVTGKPEHESPYITKFKGVITQPQLKKYITIQEFADGGDLKGVISKIDSYDKKKYSASDILNVKRYIAENIIKGMVHISENRDMMHLDIKPENILFDKSSGTFKIADFGFSSKNMIKVNEVGTANYMAPEVYTKDMNYDKSVDQWSIGLTLQELMKGKIVFDKPSMMGKIDHTLSEDFIKSGKSLREVEGKTDPTELSKMIHNLVQADPTKRPKFSDILKMPYFQDTLLGTNERAVEILREILG